MIAPRTSGAPLGRRPLRVLVSGRVGGADHQGGAVWSVLQYLDGLVQLGHSVYFVEPLPAGPSDQPLGLSAPVRYAEEVLSAAGFGGRWWAIDPGTRAAFPRPYSDFVTVARGCDLLINISGRLQVDEVIETIPVRVYLDVDPVFTQLWQDVEGIDLGLRDHTHHVTVGLGPQALGGPVPDCGFDWISSVPPVALRHWPVAGWASRGSVTSVGNWRSYGSIQHQGISYGQRAHSLRRIAQLPSACNDQLMLALAIDPAERPDLDLLGRSGWVLVDPRVVAGTPRSYRAFIRRSKAELCVAKSGYVVSRCGWFSDRSACYLASGRPVVAQDTGFSKLLPTGEGLFSFDGVDDAAETLNMVSADYRRQSVAARRIAEEHLDARLVLGSLLERVDATR